MNLYPAKTSSGAVSPGRIFSAPDHGGLRNLIYNQSSAHQKRVDGFMKHISLHNKDRIYSYLKKDLSLHIYSIGDLDDFFWPFTTWYGLVDNGQLKEVVLLYFGQSSPTLLALSRNTARLHGLLEKIKPLLPPLFYAHLSPTVQAVFEGTHSLTHHGKHQKMTLPEGATLPKTEQDEVQHISAAESDAVKTFYRTSYPGNWFDPRMLESGQYAGIKKGEDFISVAGVHVYSPTYNVAALGNIATHPQYRDQGLATKVTAYLCRSLRREVDTIGLNVKVDNKPAIACYKKLGFKRVAEYHEYTIRKK